MIQKNENTTATIHCFPFIFASGSSATPVLFVPNKGQWSNTFDFKAKIRPGYAAFFEKHSITFLLSDYGEAENKHHNKHAIYGQDRTGHDEGIIKNHAYRVAFIGAGTIAIHGESKLPYYHNYFLGGDKSKWRGHVDLFSGIRYERLYPGIDLTYKTNKDNNTKYEFIVSPQAPPQSIRMHYTGADISIAANGNLHIKTSLGEVVEYAPYSFQVINGKTITVASHFVISNNVVSFVFPKGYNKSYELVIDPVVEYQSWSGGACELRGQGSSYSADGKMFSLATVLANGWPATTGAYQTNLAGSWDMALNVYTPDGSNLVYSTYIGGNGTEEPASVSVNSLGQAVIVGLTNSTDFPVTAGCLQPLNKGLTDGVAVVLSSDGAALLSGSYYGSKGGEESIEDAIWSSDTTFYVYGKCGGNTTTANKLVVNMPVNAYKPNNTGRYGSYVLKLNTAQTQLLAGTYIGHSPSGMYQPKVLRLDEYTGEILIGGYATSNANYPTTANAFQLPNAANDFYGTISKFDAALTTLAASSCLYNMVAGIDTDPDGNIYALGTSTFAITASPGVYAENNLLHSNTFLVKMDPGLTGTLLSTNLPPNLTGYKNFAFERSNCGHFYAYYPSTDPNIALTPPYPGPATPNTIAGGGSNIPNSYYLIELGKDFQNLIFGGWLGIGSTAGGPLTSHWHSGTQDIDPEGRIYANQCAIVGLTGTAGAWSPVKQTGYIWDAAVTVVDMEMLHDTTHAAITVLPDTFICIGDAFQFNGTLSGPATYSWNFGDGSAAETGNLTPEHTYAAPGIYSVTLEAINPEGCDFISADTDTVTVAVLEPETVSVYPQDTAACNTGPIQVHVEGAATCVWAPAELVDNPTSPVVWVHHAGENNLTATITDHHKCLHTRNVHIGMYHAMADAGPDRIIILGKKELVTMDGTGCTGANIYWDADPTLRSTASLTPVAMPRQTTWYYINAEDHTCKSRDSAKVTVAAFGSPNAFSPNGDGLNDLYRIFTNEDHAFIVNISIYNRFGERVFFSENNEGWDGRYRGRPCDAGTYFYTATVTIEDAKYDLKGDITLIR